MHKFKKEFWHSYHKFNLSLSAKGATSSVIYNTFTQDAIVHYIAISKNCTSIMFWLIITINNVQPVTVVSNPWNLNILTLKREFQLIGVYKDDLLWFEVSTNNISQSYEPFFIFFISMCISMRHKSRPQNKSISSAILPLSSSIRTQFHAKLNHL